MNGRDVRRLPGRQTFPATGRERAYLVEEIPGRLVGPCHGKTEASGHDLLFGRLFPIFREIVSLKGIIRIAGQQFDEVRLRNLLL
jgi:hypothetical protein